jgi:hypothetical protein
MPPGLVIRAHLEGAFKLARFDASGAEVFGNSAAEAWFSFLAAFLVAPMIVMWIVLDGFSAPEDTPLLTAAVFEFMSYVIGWLLFPVIAFHLLVFMDKDDRYPGFINAYNWTAVIQNGLFLGMHLALGAMGAPDEARALMGVMMLAYVLMYGWFVARTILEVNTGPAVMVVALDLVVALVWEAFSNNLFFG